MLLLDNPLLVDLVDKESKKSLKTSQWFSNPAFTDILEKDQDEEMLQTVKGFQIKGGKLISNEYIINISYKY